MSPPLTLQVVFPSMSEEEFDLSSLHAQNEQWAAEGDSAHSHHVEEPAPGGSFSRHTRPSHEYVEFTSESERR